MSAARSFTTCVAVPASRLASRKSSKPLCRLDSASAAGEMRLRHTTLQMNRQQKNGRHPRDCARSAFIALIAMGLFFTSSLHADELDDLLVYAKAGAPHLTIKLIEQRQPDQQANLQ